MSKSNIKNNIDNVENQNIINNDHKKKIIERSIYGVLMGISDGIPGYSGGTTLSLLNFYETFIYKTKRIFKPFNKNIWWRNILWLVPFVLFWVISLVLFSVFGKFLATGQILGKDFSDIIFINDTGYAIVLILMFSFFSLFSIPLFWWANKPKVFFYKNENIDNKKKIINLVLFIIGFLLILIIGLIVFFLRDGIDLTSSSNVNKLDYSVSNLLLIPISSFVAGFAMLFPGISGSLTLYLFNTYDDIYWTIIQHPISNIIYLLICGICILLGIFTCIFTTNILIKKFKDQYYNFCFGMICSSFIAILLAGKKYYSDLSINYPIAIPLIIVSLIVVISINTLIYIKIKNDKNNTKIDTNINLESVIINE